MSETGRVINPDLWLEKKVRPKGSSSMQWLVPTNIPYLVVKADYEEEAKVETYEYPNLKIPKEHLEFYTA